MQCYSSIQDAGDEPASGFMFVAAKATVDP